MTEKEKLAALEYIMDLDEGTLSMDDVLENYEEWDSLSKLTLIAEVKKMFGRVLNVETIKNIRTVKDACDCFSA